MKKFLTLLLLLLSIGVYSQYGNEWINYNQKYYSFKIVKDGIYRLTYEDLLSAGIPVNTIPHQDIKIYGKEKQVPLYIEVGNTPAFDSTDFIEFYAERNDGWLDQKLYETPADIANPEYSLYNDTLIYFITWSPTPSQRYFKETDINYSAYNPTRYVWNKSIKTYSNKYYYGTTEGVGHRSIFEEGEGWGGGTYNGGPNWSGGWHNLPTPNIYGYGQNLGQPNAIFKSKTISASNASFSGAGNHQGSWYISQGNNTYFNLTDTVFTGYKSIFHEREVNVNELNNGTSSFLFEVPPNLGVASDRQAINYLSIEYPQTPTSANYLEVTVDDHSQGKNYIKFAGGGGAPRVCYVLGGNVPRKTRMEYINGEWHTIIPNANNGKRQKIIISRTSLITNVTEIKPVTPTGFFTDYSQINADSAYIIIYNKKIETGAFQYAAYRGSVAGGQNNVLTAEVKELYLQYGGGIEKHVLGLKRFLNHVYDFAQVKPAALLILGKGVREANPPNSTFGIGTRKNNGAFQMSLVPSYGYPSSDILLTTGFTPQYKWVPAIPTGRVSVKDNNELIAYLNKVKDFELAQDQNSVYTKDAKEWQKKVLHFGGGSTAAQQNLFKAYLGIYENTIEGADFGGEVFSFYKTTSNPINPVDLNVLFDKLQTGVSLMTFFGHATPDGFDLSVEDPQNWNNQGKYPILIGNACLSGNIFLPNYSSASEEFNHAQDAGTIGFLSSSEYGYPYMLNIYTAELYRQMGIKNYGQTFAQQIQETIKVNEQNFTNNFLLQATTAQMVFHGDPGLRLNWHAKPEIDVEVDDVFFTPEDVSLATDSLTVNVILTNLGRAITDTFNLEVRRDFPLSALDSVYNVPVNGLLYKDTIRLTIPLQTSIALGVNNFQIQVDLPSFIPENYDEFGNNKVDKTFYYKVDGIIPVLPHNYAVVPEDKISVKASTVNPIADYNTYLFEIDTTDLFNSPERRVMTKSGIGGVYKVAYDEWKNASSNMIDPLILEDSVAYFWRVAVDSTVPQWREYSFQYIEGKEGWGQDHFFQFKNGGFNNVDYVRADRKREFGPVQKTISAEVYDHSNSVYTMWKLNGAMVDYAICQPVASIHVAVVDPVTLEPWISSCAAGTFDPAMDFGNVNDDCACRPRSEGYFIFRQNSVQQLKALNDMLETGIPDGYYYIVYTARNAEFGNWQNLYPGLFNTFQNTLGSDSIFVGQEDMAFIHIGQKGNPAFTTETVAQNVYDFIELEAVISGFDYQGSETSTIIGPAAEWKTLYWKQNALENPTGDSTRLVIQALDYGKNVMLTYDTLFTSNDSITNFNQFISADAYPYLRLIAKYEDRTTLTPAQVDRWHVLYSPLPEAAIDGSQNFYTWLPSKDTLNEGEDISFAIDVRNIDNIDMDSLLVRYWIEDKDRNIIPIPYPRQDSLRVTDVLRDTITFNTLGLDGFNSFWMEVNPYVNGSLVTTDQPELAHFNNVLQRSFYVKGDDVNPILDVTFDGIHILNGDIVNPKAEIVITLKDDNDFLVMDSDTDTTQFGVFITDPDGIQKKIPFMRNGQVVMEWIPANNQNRRFKIIYPSLFEKDGIYELYVQGADRSGNLSGDLEYKVTFEVINASTITQMMNYPNPFSTSTQFVFTLTGSKVPDEIRIQIMTVTGTVVRTITEDEIGPIRIGRNITEYAWDGRDDFGDQLANGVYIYRVDVQIDGEDITRREVTVSDENNNSTTLSEKYFKNNFGKMYLIR